MSDEYEDEYEESVVAYVQPTAQRMDPWNIAGVGLTMVAAYATATGQALNMVAMACWKHATWREQEREAQEYAEYQAELEWQAEQERERMMHDLERMTGIDTYWLEQEQGGDDG